MAVVQAPLGGTAQTDDEDQPAAAPAGGLGALAAGQFAGLSGPYQALYQQMQQKADAQRAAQQEYLASMQKQEGALSQTGMSDLDRASLMFQAAGALGQTTRSGGFGETLGNLGSAMAGPLSKAAEAQRTRAQQLQQLQLARQKLGMEMAGTGGVDPAQAMQLLKAQQDAETGKGAESFKLETIDDKPVLVGSRGTVKPFDRQAAGIGETETKADSLSIPAEGRAAGPEAVKKYKEAYGTKMAAEMATAQTSSDNLATAIPVLDRAEKAYKELSKSGLLGSSIGPMSASGVSRTIQGAIGTQSEIQRQNFEAAAKELELLQAQIKMKGQGAITEGERRILQMTLPRLDAADPSTGLETLRTFRQQLQSAIEKPERIRQRGGEQQPQQGKVVKWGDLP
jgi:hypothetical protein